MASNPPPEQLPAVQPAQTPATQSFDSLFDSIVGGFTPIGAEVDKGTGRVLLTCGILLLLAGVVAVLAKAFGGLITNQGTFTAADLAVLMITGLLLIASGAGVRIWDRTLLERGRERDQQMRVAAAQQAANVLIGTSQHAAVILQQSAPAPPPPVPPYT